MESFSKENRPSLNEQVLNDNLQSSSLTDQPIIDIIMPVYNEVEIIRSVVIDFYREIANKLPCRFIVAEDGSVDGTREVLLSLKNEVPISLFHDDKRKGYCKGVGDALKRSQGEWVFFSDSDGQYFPSDFWRLWQNRGNYDMIIGRKLHRSEGLHRTILANGFHNIVNNLFDLNLHDSDCGFRLIRKELVDSIVNEVKYLNYSFWAEFTIRACLKGFRISEVTINHSNRASGGSQIYKPSKIPLIVLKQLKGLVQLRADITKG